MSVPGRIGTILIIALALLDALMLASGARRAANAIESHALLDSTPAPAALQRHEPLISSAIREINLWTARPPRETPFGV